jgi:hypothetical protein
VPGCCETECALVTEPPAIRRLASHHFSFPFHVSVLAVIRLEALDLDWPPPAPPQPSEEIRRLDVLHAEKTVFADNIKYQILYDSDLHKFTKKNLLSVNKDSVFKFKVLHTPTQTLWSSRPHKNHNKIKLFIPLTTYYESLIIDTCGNTQGLGYIFFEDIITANKVKDVLSSNLYRFVANITRWSNFNVPMVMKNLPCFPDNLLPTNENIYNYFKLSKGEIDLIESSIKPNKFTL